MPTVGELVNPTKAIEEIYFWVEFSIVSGKLDEFKKVLRETIELEEREDRATQSFQCFFNSDGTICHIQECYGNSNAILEHFSFARRQGGVINRLLESSRLVRSEVHGNLTPDAAAAVARFQSIVFSHFGGFTR